MKSPKNRDTLETLIAEVNALTSTKPKLMTLDRDEIDEAKTNLVKKWLEQPQNNCDLDTLKNRILPIVHRTTDVVIAWLSRPENNNLENLKRILALAKSGFEFESEKLVRVWLEMPGNNFDLDALRDDILPIMRYRVTTVGAWLAHPQNNTLENLRLTLPLLDKVAEPLRSSFVVNWLTSSPLNSVETLEEVLPLIVDHSRANFVLAWLTSPNNANFDNLRKVLPRIKDRLEQDRNEKIRLINSLAKNIADKKLDGFFDLQLVDKNDTGLVVAICGKIPNFGADDVIDLCDRLYPTAEILKVDLVIGYIAERNFTDQNQALEMVGKLVNRLQDDDIVLYAINLATRRFQLTEIGILDLVKNRLHSRYESIAELLKLSSSLEASLTEEGFDSAKMIFGEDAAQSISLADLFSYHSIRGNMADFMALVRPEIKEQIRQNFKPSDKKPYIDEQEYEKLKTLIGGDFELPETSGLCDFIVKQVEVPQLTDEMIDVCEIDFTDTILEIIPKKSGEEKSDQEKERDELQLKKQKEANELFKIILRSKPIAQEDAVELLVMLQPEIANTISEENKTNLAITFAHHRNELASLLSSEGGMARFLAAIPSLSDGCIKNIGNQITSAVIASLIRKPALRSLYSVVTGQVIFPLLNDGGDVIMNESDPFQNSTVRKSVIVPDGFVTAIRHEFIDDQGKIRVDPWNFLEKTLGRKRFGKNFIKSALLEITENMEELDKKITDLACHLILKRCAQYERKDESLPEEERFFPKIIDDKILKVFRSTNRDLLKKLEAKIAQKEEEIILAESKGESSQTPSKKITGATVGKAVKPSLIKE